MVCPLQISPLIYILSRHCSDVCNILLNWTALLRRSTVICRKEFFITGNIKKTWQVGRFSSDANIRQIRTTRMKTSSNGNIFRVTGPLCGEFTGPGDFPTQRPVTRSFDVFFDLRLNKRLSKQPRGWWFETPAWSLWRHRNGFLTDT